MTNDTEDHPFHFWHMTEQVGQRCEWECVCNAHRTTFDGNYDPNDFNSEVSR